MVRFLSGRYLHMMLHMTGSLEDVEKLIKQRVGDILQTENTELINQVLPSLRKVTDMDAMVAKGEAIVQASKAVSHEAACKSLATLLFEMPCQDVIADLIKLQSLAQHDVQGRGMLARDSMRLLVLTIYK